ncbi:MAG: hypothetical protein KDK70_32845, partial [Myxococcales bacterium]|nr:hypothetical protein [Myxococcales bacterium]
MQWSTFLQAHWGAVCAADFFTVVVLTPLGLSRRHVLFVIDLETRAVEIAGIVAEPYEQWIMNMVRGLLDHVDGFLLGKQHGNGTSRAPRRGAGSPRAGAGARR